MRQRDRLAGHNERMKLLANSVNAVGLAVVAIGIVRPLIDDAVDPTWTIFVYVIIAVALHALAHYIVSQVEMDT